MRILGLPNAGRPNESIESLVNGGVCFEKDLPSQVSAGNYQKSAGEILQKSLMNYYSGSQWVGARLSCAWDLKKVFPGVDYSTIAAVLKEAHEKKPVLFLAESSCRRMLLNKGKPAVKRFSLFQAESGKTILDKVDELLNNGVPMSFTYGAAIFEHEGRQLRRMLETSLHASVIVGRKYDCRTNKWNYIIRNSWSDDHCQEQQKYFKENTQKDPPYQCDKGHYIVPGDLLLESITSIDWLE